MGIRATGLAVLAMLAAPCAAQAATVTAERPQSVVDALVAQGFKGELTKDDLGDPMVKAEIGRWKALVLFDDCSAAHDGCQSLQLVSSFDAPDKGITPQKALEIARQIRFAAITLNADGDPTATWDVVTGAGIDDAVFGAAIKDYKIALDNLGHEVFGN
ncbi:YbjN domain-containing protein [Novosphingobium lentum]|uniref:YbjN domain-containing protein n=1 Tax=Novosphingobium lentum TaxID=145287 RepID=UPI00082ED114|nr:YbjN domain-containing protein [Novosphingobium lentum]